MREVNFHQKARAEDTDMSVKREASRGNYFDDLSQWWENRYRKLTGCPLPLFSSDESLQPVLVPQISPVSSNCRQKVTQVSFWLEDFGISPLVEQELTRSGLTGTRNEEKFKPAMNESLHHIIRLLKDCTTQKDLDRGSKIHAYIQDNFLEHNSHVASTLVNMYAKCGALSKAHQVLEEVSVRDVVIWNALITGYAQQGQGWDVLECFDSMQLEGHFPNEVAFTCALKACGSIGATAKGEQIHEMIASLGLLVKNAMLRSSLVNMYAKCGALPKAQQVFELFPVRDVVSWTALIAGYAQQEQGEEALKCYDSMLREGHAPNAVALMCALKACASIKAAAKGEQIHDTIVSLGILEKNVVLANALVDMYTKCSDLAKAHRVLKELPIRTVVTWNALIAGYAQQGQGEEALKCYDGMQLEGHSPNVVTFTCALKACGAIGAAAKGELIHNRIAKLGMLEEDVVLGSVLVDMYVKCSGLEKAHQVLEQLPVRGVATWNALIAGFVLKGRGEEALKYYDCMQWEGHTPDAVTAMYGLKACGILGAVAKGEQIHDMIVSLGLLEGKIVLGSALIDMYAKCGALAKAQQVLEQLSLRDVVSWSTLIAGYAQQGQGERALNCFSGMQHEGHTPDAVTFTFALRACRNIESVAKGEQIHEMLVRLGMLEENFVLWSILVDMYAKLGALVKAHRVLKELPFRDIITWNALITGYAHQAQGEEALKCFDSMEREGHSPDAITFACALKACGSIGAAAKGEQIHDVILNLGILEVNIVLGSTVVDMYAKCGSLARAQQVFEQLPVRDVVSWTALIMGYAQQGQGEKALNCFQRMESEEVKPESATFICVLNACGHSGLSFEAEILFSRMSRRYGITPNVEHYSCMVNLFSRMGKIKAALLLIGEMPCAEDMPLWVSLLGACREWGDVNIGRWAFNHALCLD